MQKLMSRQHAAKIRGYIAHMQMDLHGKHALVCGASQGIGLAAARELASLGAKCTLLARNEGRLIEAVQSLPGEGHGHLVRILPSPKAFLLLRVPLWTADRCTS